ncbi:MAG: Molybdopterin oxidoreductase [Myxococcales bacterium]|nr:Molybdopterin oxidoreductase [Myxococcales bacterium]
MSKRAPTPPITGPGSEQWRTTEERDNPKAFENAVAAEFPPGAAELDGSSRREFMQLIGGSLALAGVTQLAGCKDPPQHVLPYNVKPTDVTPGRPLHYATALTYGGVANGVIVTAWEGRPTKIEGNPDHPVAKGKTPTVAQADILSLYDTDRAHEIKHRGAGVGWVTFCKTIRTHVETLKGDGGAKLAFLAEASGSPLLASMQKRLQTEFPKARWYGHSSFSMDEAYEGAKLAFGRPLETQLDLTKAKVVVTLDADILGGWPQWLAQQRQWAERRAPGVTMNRLYVAETQMTCTGMMADHRVRSRASDIARIARALHAAVAGGTGDAGDAKANAWVKALAKDLLGAGGEAVVIVGPRQPAAVHAMAHAINATVKSQAVSYTAPILPSYEPLTALAEELKGGRVDTLVVTAWNPSYSAPADLGLGKLLAKVPNAIYLGTHEDETAHDVAWFVPRAHELESWGDARSIDGTVTIQQPLITPLYHGICVPELWSALLGEGGVGGYQLLRSSYAHLDEIGFQIRLQKGLIEGSALAKESPTLQTASVTGAVDKLAAAPSGIEVNIVPDYKLLDGRYANNVWLQELPDPVTKLTWDNALLLSPATATKLGLARNDLAEVKLAGQAITASVLPSPGHADDSVTITLGYGRNLGTETNARGAGTDVAPLRTAGRWFAAGATITKAGKGEKLAITQEHWAQEGRPIALELNNRPSFKRLPIVEEGHKGHGETEHDEDLKTVHEQQGPVESMYQPHIYPGFKWAMAIDLNKCTGCNACVIACVAENNIPVVGKEQVRKSREMHWIRLDVYFSGDENDPSSVQPQPMMCVHCEKAPCEYVCPVNATVHSDEGLNEMIYNRCIGTRYCSNNCPYKVRRFNFLDYHPNVQNVARMGMNPDVTVRSRGVMEKCTYCVQRIERARIDARVAGREIADGEFTSACAQVCPSKAITFGSLHDKTSEVSRAQDDPRAYDVLHELGTRPRTVHLARVKNKNPEINNG